MWTRPVLPRGSFAVAFLYTEGFGYPIKVSVTFRELGLTNTNGYHVVEAFDGVDLKTYKPDDRFICRVNPTGVYLIRATVL